MTDEQKLARAMAIAEVAVQQMAEEGIEPMVRAIGLAFHMQRQAEIAMPTRDAAAAFKVSIATT
jgi:acyl-CoA thioesterase FadM